LDYQLPFYLYSALLSYGVPPSSNDWKLYQNFGFQLESIGLWTWAIYVYSFLPNEVARKRAIQETLNRFAPFIGSEEADFLNHKLQVPIEWIHESQAYYSCYLSKIEDQYFHLRAAQLHSPLLHLFFSDVIPQLVLQGKFFEIETLLPSLSSTNDAKGWEIAEIFLKFPPILSQFQRLKQSPDSEDLGNLENELLTLCKNISILSKRSLSPPVIQRASMAELAGQIANLLVEVKKLKFQAGGQSLSREVSELAPLTLDLPLSPDVRLHHLQDLSAYFMAMPVSLPSIMA